MKDVLLIGLGLMGGRWMRCINNCSNIRISGVVEPDKSSGVDDLDTTDINWYSDWSAIDNISMYDHWVISSPVNSHSQYIRKATELNPNCVVCEKPTTDSFDLTDDLLNSYSTDSTNIQVNYIDRKHLAVLSILSEMRDDFRPDSVFHWRGKTSNGPIPFIRDDLCHDISEIQLLMDNQGLSFSDMDVTDVRDVREREGSAEEYDLGAEIRLESGHTKATVRGYGDEMNQKRYFLWHDSSKDIAYFGNTIKRDHITPLAAKISGAENIRYVKEMCRSGQIIDDETIHKHVVDNSDRVLFKGSKYALEDIVDEMSKGCTDVCDFSDAVEIESVIKDVYSLVDMRSVF